jgi:hypothetical protein
MELEGSILFSQEVISLLVFTPIQVINPTILKTSVLLTYHLRPYEKQDFPFAGFNRTSISVPYLCHACYTPQDLFGHCEEESMSCYSVSWATIFWVSRPYPRQYVDWATLAPDRTSSSAYPPTHFNCFCPPLRPHESRILGSFSRMSSFSNPT